MGLLPLLPNMPVCITQTLPELKPLRLFKNSRGKLLTWCLQDADAEAARASTAADFVLQGMPRCLFIQVEGATWTQQPGRPAGVACIRPVQQQWQLAADSKASVLRRGFPVACDYAGTAHSFMGATLSACTLDLGFWDSAPSRDAQLSAYMCLSRVRHGEDLCVSRPFSPNRLSQGDLIGPRTLLEVHRQTLTLEEAKARFEQEAKQRKRHPEVQLTCRLCSFLQPGQEKLKPLHAFLDDQEASRFSVVARGMDRVCRACRSSRSASQPQPADGESTPCAWCKKTLLAEPGFCKSCQQKPLACAKCDAAKKGTKRTLADFSMEEILRRKRTKELLRARCKKCVAAALARATKASKCTQCGQWKCRTNFCAFVEKTNEGICRQCHVRASKPPEQAQMKKCPRCGKALRKLATAGSWCDSCAFPPCQAGCGNTRPRKSAYHAKNRPNWVCSKCAAKKCSECGGDLPTHAGRETWCDSCAFPPCQGGCGKARPRTSEYHAKALPSWACANCMQKQSETPESKRRKPKSKRACSCVRHACAKPVLRLAWRQSVAQPASIPAASNECGCVFQVARFRQSWPDLGGNIPSIPRDFRMFLYFQILSFRILRFQSRPFSIHFPPTLRF